MINITFLGSFLIGKTAYDGQTTKTRNYTEEVSKHFPDYVINRIDTQKGFFSLFFDLPIIAFNLIKSDVVFIFPGQRGIFFILPLVVLFKKVKGYLLLYPVVGGWLPDFMFRHRVLSGLLDSVNRVYVETKQMKNVLEKQGHSNIELAPVFTRRTASEKKQWNQQQCPYSLCTFSRVTQTKGIDLAIETVNELNQEANYGKYTLDIYGKLDPDYKDAFLSALSKSPFNAVHYCGALDDSEVMEKLALHWVMLFPTRYPGEGFPATVLEGMMAGLPIIASDWRYNSEIIEDGYNGLLFDLSKRNDLLNKIELLSSNPNTVMSMHENVLKKAKQLTPEVILKPMFELINTFLKKDCK